MLRGCKKFTTSKTHVGRIHMLQYGAQYLFIGWSGTKVHRVHNFIHND